MPLDLPLPPPHDDRNIIDHYKYWRNEAIVADLDTKRHQFAILASNLYNDFNLSQIIRCSNAFMAAKVYIYGRRKWDRRGAVGTHNYLHIEHIEDESGLDVLSNYEWIGVDNISSAVQINNFIWPTNALMCFGQEQVGLPPEIIERCKKIVYIQQYGSVRSLNVGCAAGIIMNDYCIKLKDKS